MNKTKKNIVIVGFNNEEKSLKELIESKENISEQLRLLRKYRKREDVKEYIDDLLKNEYVTDYVRYMIDKYYFGNKNAKKEEKNCVEKMFKVVLRYNENK